MEETFDFSIHRDAFVQFFFHEHSLPLAEFFRPISFLHRSRNHFDERRRNQHGRLLISIMPAAKRMRKLVNRYPPGATSPFLPHREFIPPWLSSNVCPGRASQPREYHRRRGEHQTRYFLDTSRQRSKPHT